MTDFSELIPKDPNLVSLVFQTREGTIIEVYETENDNTNSFQNFTHQTIHQVFSKSLNPKEKTQLEEWLQLICDELYVNLMTEEDLMKLCPNLSVKWHDGLVYQVTFKPILGEKAFDYVIASLIPNIDQSEYQQVNKIMQLMREVQQMDSERIKNVLEYLPVLREKLAHFHRQQNPINELKKDLHIAKGTLFFCQLDCLGHACHDLESQLQNFCSKSVNELKEWIEPVLMLFDLAEGFCINLQHSADYKDSELMTIPMKTYHQLLQNCSQLHQNSLKPNVAKGHLTQQVESLHYDLLNAGMVSITQLFERLESLNQQLATALQKDVCFQAECSLSQVHLPQIVFEKLWHACSQLLKNALDHGIESASERQKLQKKATATVTLQVVQDGNLLKLYLKDDGRGIDSESLIAKAIQQNHFSQDEISALRNDQDVSTKLIFASGVSTKNEISIISGRGMGMGAVQKEMEACSGQIQVDSKTGQFCQITLTLPIDTNYILLV